MSLLNGEFCLFLLLVFLAHRREAALDLRLKQDQSVRRTNLKLIFVTFLICPTFWATFVAVLGPPDYVSVSAAPFGAVAEPN